MDHDKLMFKQEIQQMMYVAGETQDPSVETLAMVEEIIRQQVVQMLTTANALANRRGTRLFSNNDIIFQFRHDTALLERLRTFLTWKVIRKTVKDADKDGDDKDALADDAAMEDLAADASEGMPLGRIKIPRVSFPWDVESFFSVEVPGGEGSLKTLSNEATIQRLRLNDERTRDMTAAEYTTWTDYRHASFTWRKTKRFREWSGLGVIADHRATDDVMDILGFLTSESVQKLTEEALAIQRQEFMSREACNKQAPAERRPTDGLFAQEGEVKPPVEARHIRMAFQRLQSRPKRHQFWQNSTAQSSPTGLRLF